MLAKSKRLLAPILALMIVLGTIAAPASAEAATKPKAYYYQSTTRYVTRGKSLKFYFYAYPNSYTKKSYGYNNGYRARFDTDVYKKSNNLWMGYTPYRYMSSGSYSYTITGKFSKAAGYSKNTWYKMRYRTQYRKNVYSNNWYTATSKWIKIKVR